MIMSETETTRATKPEFTAAAAAKASSFADTIVDIGVSWAEAGIGIGKTALENSARALDRTAKCLSVYQERLKGSAAAKETAKHPSANGAEADLPGA
jgi:hypothetical protein